VFKFIPKFHISSPIPYNPSQFHSLHRQNINSIVQFLSYNNIGVPSQITSFDYHPRTIKQFMSYRHKELSATHPLCRLQRILELHHLTLVPSDKLKILTIIPIQIMTEELAIHLSDAHTYERITIQDQCNIDELHRSLIIKAMSHFKSGNLINSTASYRYIYLVPKTHKPLDQWRTHYHPKMRPIVSDTCSLTYKLSKFMLKPLQKLERYYSTAITSSLAAAHSTLSLNDQTNGVQHINLSTMDIESLFTNIPQDRLLDIVNDNITPFFDKLEDKITYMEILQHLIRGNTFQADDKHYLQKIGLPMGHPLSGTLANIYLGNIEQQLVNKSNILSFSRYMDDILCITCFNGDEMDQFVNDLSDNYELKITAFHSDRKVDYLDMSIVFTNSEKKFTISPFSKNLQMLPTPSHIIKRGSTYESRIICSQILRMWRLSNDESQFSRIISNHMKSIQLKTLRRKIFHYLSPIQIHCNRWSTNIIICNECLNITSAKYITISKIMKFDHEYIATNSPLSCYSTNVCLFIRDNNTSPTYIQVPTIHHFLSHLLINNISITPMKFSNTGKFSEFLRKHPSIPQINTQDNPRRINPCRIHNIFHQSSKIYGIPVVYKERNTIGKQFNNYKKLFGRKKMKITSATSSHHTSL
jgi:hypothetical protein